MKKFWIGLGKFFAKGIVLGRWEFKIKIDF